MKKIDITLSFDEEKLEALEFSLRKEKPAHPLGKQSHLDRYLLPGKTARR